MKKLIIFLVAALILGFAAYKVGVNDKKDNSVAVNASSESSKTGTTPEKDSKKEEAKEVTIKISAIGDCALGFDSSLNYSASLDDVFKRNNSDINYFFSKVKDVFVNDDLTIANLETALTTESDKAEKYDYGNNYWFKGNPAYASILKAGNIEVVSLSNNHTYDYKQKGYDDTKSALKETGIGYFGYDDIYQTEVKGIKIGMAGFNQLGSVEQGTDKNELKADIKKKIETLRKSNNFVIVTFHWGKEYKYQFNNDQQELGRYAIDCGADVVIGSHPHVIQGVEQYKGKYIVYSLGNFCFGGNAKPKDYDTFIYQQEFVFNKDKTVKKVEAPEYIPCSISTTKNINNFQPVISTGSDAKRILNKINQYSPYKLSSEKIAEISKPDMVNLEEFIPEMIIDLRYASTNNFTGKELYKNKTPYLRRETAVKLKKANEILNKQGYKVKLWDGYRPQYVQQYLWDNAINKKYFADPKIGSNHTRGGAVDITLTDMDGKELDMPSDFDDQAGKAERDFKYATSKQKQNALLLEKALKQAGFTTIKTEWWHFDDSNWRKFELINEYDG